MNCILRKILIFGDNLSQRSVDFHSGLNVITGHSKKGKSALIEITDYCLCSSLSTIPKGIISEYARLYCIVLEIDKSFLIIARPAWSEDDSTRIYVEYEDADFELNSISKSYFQGKTLHRIKGAGQEIIERHLGLNVSNTQLPESDAKARKASLRNMTPFLFQYQNLVASKHALFSKLEDHYKKKDIIDQIPIFLGIANEEYYTLRRQIDELEQKLKKIDREKQRDQSFHEEYSRKLEGLYRNYFAVVGVPYKEIHSLQQLISLRLNLPELDDSEFLKTDAVRRYNSLKKTQASYSFQLDELNSEISNITQTQNSAKKTAASLNTEREKNANAIVDEHFCPICGSEVQSLEEQAIQVKSALSSLSTEISSMVNFARYDAEQLEILRSKRRKLQNQIRANDQELKVLQEHQARIAAFKNKRESITYLKAQIEFLAEQVSRKTSSTDYGDSNLRAELAELKKEISNYNFDSDIQKSEANLADWMSKVCNNLDFEDEFSPANLSMKLDELVVYHTDPKHGRVSLSDMGSGANWLAFHLSASLAMLRLFAQSNKSVVPSFLFLDQPSQVYFPDNFSQDNIDKKNVENIYVSIINELSEIEDEVGFKPQVIVLDHANDLDLGEYKFSSFIRKDWHSEDALI